MNEPAPALAIFATRLTMDRLGARRCGRWTGWPALVACCLSTAVAAGGARAAGEVGANAATPPSRLEAVVVTDEKSRREQDQRTPSVATRSGRQIEESPAGTVEDVIGRMANVSTTYGLAIRGIPLYGPNGGNSKTAWVTVDGVPQDGVGQGIGTLSVWDAASVDVLRGPQSSQGRHALAGTVAVKTRNPTGSWDLRGRASLADPQGRNLAVAGGGPLAGDVLAFRLSAEDQRDDGSTYNRTRDDRRWSRDDRKTVRGKLRFTPAGADYRAQLTLADDRREHGSDWVESTLLAPSRRVSLANEPSATRNTSRTAALEQTLHGLGIDWTLLSTWGGHRYRGVGDYDESELHQGTTSNARREDQQSHELRGRFEGAFGPGRLDGVFGLYWAKRRVHGQTGFALPLAYVLTDLGSCPDRASCDALYPSDAVMRDDSAELAFTNRAVYTEVDYQLGALAFTAGLRHERESQSREIDGRSRGSTAAAGDLIGLLQQDGAIAPDGPQRFANDFSAWLPKLGARYRFDPRWALGFTAQRGYRTGGVNFSYQRGPNTFEPEFTNNYDLSLKGLVGDSLLVNLSAYRIDWRKQQVDVGTNTLGVLIVNAGRSRLQGLELEVRGKAGRALELFGAFGASRTRFVEFTSPSGDYAGKQFTLSPTRTWSLGATWKPGAFIVNADLAHESQTFGNPGNTADRVNPSHTLLNGKVSHAVAPKARVFVAGQNLLDEDYTVYRSDNAANRQVVQLGRGRALRVGVEAEF